MPERTQRLTDAVPSWRLSNEGIESDRTSTVSGFRISIFRLAMPILRKEVIQPQVPLRLPCYDFTPVADPAVAGCPPCGLAHRLKAEPTPMV